MKMSKRYSLDDACASVKDGDVLLIGGFGQPGTPNTLIRQILEMGIKDLTLVKNDANEPGLGVSLLLEAGRVRKMISSHVGLNPLATSQMHDGRLEMEIYPQGILAEKLRAAGCGLGGILSDIGIHLEMNREKERVQIAGTEYLVEPALKGDIALIRAAVADESGNLVFSKTGQNFCQAMAMAAELVIVEVEKIVPVGHINPEHVHLPGAFVDRLVQLNELGPEYGVLNHHALQG